MTLRIVTAAEVAARLTYDVAVPLVRDAMTSKTGQATPRMEFRGEYLHAFMDTDRVTSHLPVQIQRGLDQFTADGMDYDNTQRVMNMQGRVRGTLAPSGVR